MVSYFLIREKYIPYYEKIILEGFIMLSMILMLLFVVLLLVFAIALCAIKYLGIILIGGGLIYLGFKVLKTLF